MKITNLYLLIAVSLFLYSCQKDDHSQLDAELTQVLEAASPTMGLSSFIMPQSKSFDQIPQDPNNPISTEKVTLGRLLFHETALAMNPERPEGMGTYSCASCHFSKAGFSAGRFQGIGDGGAGFGEKGEGRHLADAYSPDEIDVQPLRSPSAMNGAYQEVMLWNGQFGATGPNEGTENLWTEDTPIATNHLGYQGLEIQAIAGLGVHRMQIDEEELEQNGYLTLFDAAFPDKNSEERYTLETAGLAIAAYERTLLANQAPFQRWLNGNTWLMTESEKKGAILFFGKANCVSCHSGPALNSMSFHALGMSDLADCPEEVVGTDINDQANLGRASFTGNDADRYEFKTPQLYNLRDANFLGHGSSFRNVREVVEYKNNGVKQNSRVDQGYLSEEFRSLNLSKTEIDDLTAFINNSLYDPNLSRYDPPWVLSGQCFPNNDAQSQTDLGCQ